jgi:aspartyl-tRNA(Asn)/glutamyl-tRNA(Gln) amidotransferase subunit C
MAISRQEVAHVAGLARLELDSAQLESYAEELSQILNYMDKLGEVDTEGVEPTYHALGSINVEREDKVQVRLTRDEVLANAPEANEEAIIVPKII